MDVTAGNASDADTGGTGWFIGFSEWTRTGSSDLLYVPREATLSGLCVKWYDHPAGHDSGDKPISEGRSVSIMVSNDSVFRIDFCESAGFKTEVKSVVLKRHGDFAAWGPGLHHRWRCESRSTILTLRWREG